MAIRIWRGRIVCARVRLRTSRKVHRKPTLHLSSCALCVEPSYRLDKSCTMRNIPNSYTSSVVGSNYKEMLL